MDSEKRLMVYMLGGFEMYYDGAPIRFKKKLTAKPLLLLQLLLNNREAGVSRRAVTEALYGGFVVLPAQDGKARTSQRQIGSQNPKGFRRSRRFCPVHDSPRRQTWLSGSRG